jgi:nicotinamidase-related amidase
MLIDAENSLLLVVDVQERLLPAMHESETMLRNVAILIEAARRLDIPVIATEQYPQGLGPTVAALASLLPEDCTLNKIYFSGLAEPSLGKRIAETGRSHILICGAEAHVCVLQTADELQALTDRQVFVVADATASRTVENHRLALERLARNGVEILSTEMAVFEWLRRADTDQFRKLLALVK